jgi:hypothetical protein
MNDDFITYELAKKLKEKGYPQDVFIGYDEFGALCIGDEHSIVCAAPIISQVLKWLREKKNIYLEIVIVVDAEYMCDIYKINPRPIECLGSTEYFKTYEPAALAGIEYVLDNLI